MSEQVHAKSRMADKTVVDIDVHVQPKDDELAPYIEKPYRGQVQPQGSDTSNTAWRPNTGFDFYNGGKIENLIADFREPGDIEAYSSEFNIDQVVLNSFESLARFPNRDFAEALMRGYNDWFLDSILDEVDNDHHGLINIAPQKPHRAAEEIDRLADEKQMVGVYIGNTAASPPLGDEKYDPIYRAAEDNDLPISFHSRVGDIHIGFPGRYRGIQKVLTAHSVGHMWTASLTLASLVVNGAPVKFPDLTFNITESGIAWIPFMMWRLNEEYSHRPNQAPLLEKTPEQYIRSDSFYFSTQPLSEPDQPGQIADMAEIVGMDNLMFASDYPHFDFNNVDSIYNRLCSNSSLEESSKFLAGNAAEVFGLEI